ncbi:hypothetical protein KJ640_08275 [bacterium]|nr:hypothetical protein [bacterium]
MPADLISIIIIIIFIIPGFICEWAFSLLVSRKEKEATYLILECITLSCLYYAFFSWAIVLIFHYKIYEYIVWFAIILSLLLFILPIIVGYGFGKAIFSNRLRRFREWLGITIPIPKAWDCYFGRSIPCWVLITLNDGVKIGGFWGPDSFVSSFPSPEDIYLEILVKVDENGNFGEVEKDTRGALIERERIKIIEFFKYRPKGGEEDG